MSKGYTVVSSGKWPSGSERTAAVLKCSIQEIEEVIGERFLPGMDDLGPFSQCGLSMGSGRLALLQSYDQAPEHGVTVWVDSKDNPEEAVGELLSALGWDAHRVRWMAPADPGT